MAVVIEREGYYAANIFGMGVDHHLTSAGEEVPSGLVNKYKSRFWNQAQFTRTVHAVYVLYNQLLDHKSSPVK